MRRVLSLGLIVGGVVLIALSLTGLFTPSIPCNDTLSGPASSMCPAPWGSYIVLESGIALVIVGLVSYPRSRGHREGASAVVR